MKKLIIFTLLAFCNAACFLKKDVSPALGELLISGKGVVSGSVVTKNLSAGGEIAVNGMKLIATAGAVKGDVSLQALSNTIEEGMPAIRITAEILKPIEFEMPYNGSEQFPENLRIAFQLSSGLWMYSDNVKVDATKKVLKIKLSAKYNLKKARKGINEPKTVDLASARIFFIKPETAKVKIGESVSLEVYAREGYIRQNISKAMRDEFLDDDTDLSIDDFLKNKQLEKEIIIKNLEEAGEEVTPLHLITNDYKFSNKKTGYTRSWTVSGVGKVAETGNSGAKYTAPNEASAKGKRVKVTFESTNIKTGRKAIATGNVLIDDELTRYVGTFSIYEKRVSVPDKDGRTYTYESKATSQAILTQNGPTSSRFDTYEGGTSSSKIVNMESKLDFYKEYSSNGDNTYEITNNCSAKGYQAGHATLNVYLDKKTIAFSPSILIEGNSPCTAAIFCNNCFPKNRTDKTSVYLLHPGDINQSFTDEKLLSGSVTETEKSSTRTFTQIITWEFKKQ